MVSSLPLRPPKNHPTPCIFPAILRIFCALLLGGVCYLLTLSCALTRNHASLSGYNNIGSITLSGILAGLPENIVKTYHFFGVYYLSDTLKLNRLQYIGGLYAFLVLLVVVLICIGLRAWRIQKPRLLLVLLAAAAIPVACSAYMLLAGNGLGLQMSAGLALLIPLTALAAFSVFQRRFSRIVCALFFSALLYGNGMQVWTDQEAMYEGRNACVTMAAQVLDDLREDELLSTDYTYFFVGVPARNEFFSVSDGYAHANGYAQVGNFWVSGNCGQNSYHGLISKYMGFSLPMSPLYYDQLEDKDAISAMPSFPNDGYITMLDDHTVLIKISEHAAYSDYASYAAEK